MRTMMARWSWTLALLLAACCPALATDGTLTGSGGIWAGSAVTGTYSLDVRQSGSSISGTLVEVSQSPNFTFRLQVNITSGDIAGNMSGSYEYSHDGASSSGTAQISYSTTGGEFNRGWIRVYLSGSDGSLYFEITGERIVLTLAPSYTVSLLYDSSRYVKRGAAYPIKIQVKDASGTNVSSSSLAVTALGTVKTGEVPAGDPQDTGNANPSSGFRYDAALGGYIYNVNTSGLGTGEYVMQFTVGNGSTVYEAPFRVR